MKLSGAEFNTCLLMSPPVRGCGLKPVTGCRVWQMRQVTPRAGVWIETVIEKPAPWEERVTPRAGVWIETMESTLTLLPVSLSPPVRGCGLKLCFLRFKDCHSRVTPRAGVWIETL